MHQAPLAATECRVAEKVLGALARRHKSGNVVFSPHAVTRATALLATLTSGPARAELLKFLEQRDLDALVTKLQLAERGFLDPVPVYADVLLENSSYELDWEAEQRLFDYLSASAVWGFDSIGQDSSALGAWQTQVLPLQSSTGPAKRDDVLRGWVAEAMQGRVEPHDGSFNGAGMISAVDLRLSGVPSYFGTKTRQRFNGPGGRREADFVRLQSGPGLGCVGEHDQAWWEAAGYGEDELPPTWTGGPALVTVSVPPVERLADWNGSLPLHQCAGLYRDPKVRVHLDLRVPGFCARKTLHLQDIAPDLGLSLSPPRASGGAQAANPSIAIALPARLELDLRGTVNRPRKAETSPRAIRLVYRSHPKDELVIDRPFLVTVHDPHTGAIFYTAWIEEPGAC